MAPNILCSGNEEVVVREADFTEFAVVVGFRDRDYKISCSDDRIIVLAHPEARQIGFVRRGSDFSGAIWLNDNCVAEYLVTTPGKYQVIEIKDTFRIPENEIEIDPVLYLLDAAWSYDNSK